MVEVKSFDLGHGLRRHEAGPIRHGPLAPLRGGRVWVRVRCAEVWETREEVGVRPEPVGGDLALGEHG